MPNDNRDDWYSVQVLDTNLSLLIQEISIAQGGSITRRLDSKVRSTGNVTVTVDSLGDIPWNNCLFRVLHHNNLRDPLPIFTGYPAVGDERYSGGQIQVDVDLYDTTSVLEDESLGLDRGYPQGDNAVYQAKAVILNSGLAGLEYLDINDYPRQFLPSGMSFSGKDRKLDVINQLLDAVAFEPLWSDPEGRLRASLYVEPFQKTPVQSFQDDESSFIVPGWVKREDRYDIPNRVRATQRVEGSQPAMIAVAEFHDDNSPYSFEGRGERWITRDIDDIQCETHDQLMAAAWKELNKALMGAGELDMEHPVLGFFENETINFSHSLLGVTEKFLCIEQRYSLRSGEMVSSTFKRVYNAGA